MGKLKAYHLKFEVVSQCTLTRPGNILDKLSSNCHDPGKVWNWNLHQLCNLTIGDVISVVMWVFYRPQKLSPLNFNCLVESLMVTCQLLITSNAKIKRWLERGRECQSSQIRSSFTNTIIHAQPTFFRSLRFYI